MSLIKIQDLTFSYPKSYDNIFENVNICIDTDWKLGFVGRNGRGKTTLLRLLLGEFEYSGSITSSVDFDYFPYLVEDKSRSAEEIMHEVCPQAEDWEIMRELSYLNVSCETLYRPFETLSNGEQTKLLLAALFLNDNRFLLIDEPTNHLDIEARQTVAKYLGGKKGFILVSHDRSFLDGCVDHILSLNRSNIELQSGNFSSYMENFNRRQESELAQDERLKKEIKRLQKSAKRAGEWSSKIESSKIGSHAADRGFVGHKSAKMMKRSKSIEQRQTKAIEEKSALLKNSESAEDLMLHPLRHYSDTLAVFSEISIDYGGGAVFSPLSFEIRQGERIALDGKNGSGKSSIVKLLLGEEIPHSGKLTIAGGLKISYVPQDASRLCGRLSELAEQRGIDESLLKAILRKMDFERVQFEKDIADFSGGQKKKVLIAASLCEAAHLYVWDEPLNFVDIYSRMQIERLIAQFQPTMLFIEHDGAFRESAATKVVRV